MLKLGGGCWGGRVAETVLCICDVKNRAISDTDGVDEERRVACLDVVVGPPVWKLIGCPTTQLSSTSTPPCISSFQLVAAYKAPVHSPLPYQTIMNLKSLAVVGPLAYGLLNRCVSSIYNPSLYPQLITRLQHARSCVLRCSRFRF